MCEVRWLGAILWAIAAAAIGFATLAFDPQTPLAFTQPSGRHIREVVPLALILGAGAGFLVWRRWPDSFLSAVKTSLSGVLLVVVFCLSYLVAEGGIALLQAQDLISTVVLAWQRLQSYLWVGMPAAILVFSLTGLIMRLLARLLGFR